MQEAIACEDYEVAKQIRDTIRGIEVRWLGTGRS
jgi:protein-arginine kinase activator protein McsA